MDAPAKSDVESAINASHPRASDTDVLVRTLIDFLSKQRDEFGNLVISIATPFGVFQLQEMWAAGGWILGLIVHEEGKLVVLHVPVEQCSFKFEGFKDGITTERVIKGFAQQ